MLAACEAALDELGIDVETIEREAPKVPSAGPLVIVSNHPFGGIEGVALARMLLRVRPDVRVMANSMLRALPALSDLFLFVDPWRRPDSQSMNRQTIRTAFRWVEEGGALVIFPAGEVAHSSVPFLNRARETDWNTVAARLAMRASAPVLPVYFQGRNSLLFQAAGIVHPSLRTLMLPREMVRRKNVRIEMVVGSVIPRSRIEKFTSPSDLNAYLRARTLMLHARSSEAIGAAASTQRNEALLAPAVPPGLMVEEVARLPVDACLVQCGSLQAWCTYADRIPACMSEIARLREKTFREIGEGTGRAEDRDAFDGSYRQLFIWNAATREIVGGYRIGTTDEILAKAGAGGLYTSTLFRYQEEFFRAIGPSLELGRSFVRIEYQRRHAPLMLLWKGIVALVRRSPRYRHLFGPVSISGAYSPLSIALLIRFLQRHESSEGLTRLVRPRRKVRVAGDVSWRVRDGATEGMDLDSVDELIGDMESRFAGMPVLLRQYLSLGGKILACNVDPEFSDAIDALLLVDLTRMDLDVLAFYMGREAARSYRQFHGDASMHDAPLSSSSATSTNRCG